MFHTYVSAHILKCWISIDECFPAYFPTLKTISTEISLWNMFADFRLKCGMFPNAFIVNEPHAAPKCYQLHDSQPTKLSKFQTNSYPTIYSNATASGNIKQFCSNAIFFLCWRSLNSSVYCDEGISHIFICYSFIDWTYFFFIVEIILVEYMKRINSSCPFSFA